MSRIKNIGIIAEDDTDYQAIKILVRRLTGINNLKFKPKLGGGGGRILNKSLAWSNELARRGCDLLLVFHDLDTNDHGTLKGKLETRLESSMLSKRYICIPVEEIEAWFLSDPEGIKSTFSLERIPKVDGLPETIHSPKEYLRSKIAKCSNYEITYVPRQNASMAIRLSLEKASQKCPSFKSFKTFIESQIFAVR